MSLRDLEEHIKVQEEAIAQFAAGLKANTPNCSIWGPFRDSLWGKGLDAFLKQEQVERGDRPVPTLPDPPPRFVAFLPKTLPREWGLKGGKILVRSEYEEAEEVTLSANTSGNDVLVIGGQPGIGPPPSLSTTRGT